MKKLFALLSVVLLSLSVLIGCNSTPSTSNEKVNNVDTTEQEQEKQVEEEATTFEFTDSIGRTVELPTTIEKIAPSAGLAQMVLYTAAPEMLVGFASTPSETQKQYFPEQYWDLPTFGQFHGDNFNLEALVAAAPDVIIDIGEPKDDIAESMDEIQLKTDIPTIFIQATLDTIPEMYEILGKLLNKEEHTSKLAQFSTEILTLAEKNLTKIDDSNRVSLYYGTGDKGLNTNAAGSFHLEILDYIGIENVAVLDNIASKGGGNEVSMEQLMIWNPDIILLNDDKVYERVVSGEEKAWQDLTAVQNGKVYLIPNAPYSWMGFPPSVNRIMGMNWLGNLVYPDLYTINLEETVKDYYSLFFHYELTDEEAAQLLENSTAK